MVSKAVQEWRAEGRAEGKLESLLKLLERRFGPLSKERREALRTAHLADLELWFDRALDVASIEEVFVGTH